MSVIPQYSQIVNAQSLAAQQTLATQQKQALMFQGGSGFVPPDMGGNNKDIQGLANKLTQRIGDQISLSAKDYRGTGGKKRRKTHRKKRTHRKKHNKRITKRKYYKNR